MNDLKFKTLSGDIFKNILEFVNAEGMNLAYNDIYPGLQEQTNISVSYGLSLHRKV